ncbi:hypothetical protein [Sulfurimonas sp.]
MKLLKKYFLFLVLTIFIFVDYFGLYQLGEIEIDDISISKPIGYRYSSSSSIDDNSTFSIFKNTMGLRTRFESNGINLLFLDFKKKLLNENTRIFFFKVNSLDKITIDENKCTQKKIIKKNNQYTLEDMIIYKSKIGFYIISDTKDDLVYFYRQICE